MPKVDIGKWIRTRCIRLAPSPGTDCRATPSGLRGGILVDRGVQSHNLEESLPVASLSERNLTGAEIGARRRRGGGGFPGGDPSHSVPGSPYRATFVGARSSACPFRSPCSSGSSWSRSSCGCTSSTSTKSERRRPLSARRALTENLGERPPRGSFREVPIGLATSRAETPPAVLPPPADPSPTTLRTTPPGHRIEGAPNRRTRRPPNALRIAPQRR